MFSTSLIGDIFQIFVILRNTEILIESNYRLECTRHTSLRGEPALEASKNIIFLLYKSLVKYRKNIFLKF